MFDVIAAYRERVHITRVFQMRRVPAFLDRARQRQQLVQEALHARDRLRVTARRGTAQYLRMSVREATADSGDEGEPSRSLKQTHSGRFFLRIRPTCSGKNHRERGPNEVEIALVVRHVAGEVHVEIVALRRHLCQKECLSGAADSRSRTAPNSSCATLSYRNIITVSAKHKLL